MPVYSGISLTYVCTYKYKTVDTGIYWVLYSKSLYILWYCSITMDSLGYVRIRQYILGQNNLPKLHDLEIRTHGPGLMHIAKLSTSIPLLQRSCCMMLLSCISTWCFYTVSTRYLGCMSPPGWCWTSCAGPAASASVAGHDCDVAGPGRLLAARPMPILYLSRY